MRLLRNLLGDLGALARLVAAVPAGLLPRRRWHAFPALPIDRLSLLSGLATLAAGWAVGIRGFVEFAQAASDGLATATLGAAARVAANPKGGDMVPMLPAMAASALSPLAFLVATPAGWLATYLVLTGAIRAMGAAFDDPRGDLILTGLDRLWTTSRNRARASSLARTRGRLEGDDVPDLLFRAAWAGLTDADYVVVSSRRKPGWTDGTFVITSDKWYTLGEPFDMRLPQGLRTAYPLVEQKVCEVLRRGVRYELPPLEPSPARRPRPRNGA
jgi:hypothetical protein